MSVWLRQGDRWCHLDLHARWRRPPVLAPPGARRRELVREAVGIAGSPSSDQLRGPRLPESIFSPDREADRFAGKAAAARRVCLAIPDATRSGPWLAWRAASAAWLEERTPAARRRTVLVATGLHRPESDRTIRPGNRWEVAANGEGGFGSHREVGRTPAGTPVRLHPRWVEADLRVVLADVSFHYFAGFGGGRKLVFPGLGEPEGILLNHGRCLDRLGRLRPECAPGLLEGNPVHRDLIDAVSLCPPDLLVQAYEPAPGEEIRVQAGDWRTLHEEGCAAYRAGHLLPHTCRPDLVIADAGGTPRDATFLQAHKSLQHAARFLAPGGRLLLVAGLDQGIGSETLESLFALDLPELSRRAMSDYRRHTHTALALRSVTEEIEVAVWSRTAPDRLRPAGLTPLTTEQEALEWIEERGEPTRWGWLTRAEEFLPLLIGGIGDEDRTDSTGTDPGEANS